MMKEFQAENDQRQQILAEQSASTLITNTTTVIVASTTPPPPESVSTSTASSDVKIQKQERSSENLQDLPLNRGTTKKATSILPKKSFVERNTKTNGSSNDMMRVRHS